MQSNNLSQPERKKNSLILIVDDIPKNIQLLGNILSNHGYNIAVATNGKQALTIIEKKLPDLVLLDVMMPEIDGFEVCQRIKDNPASREIPVIFLTAKHEVEDKIRGFEVGGSDYVTKPFETAEVIARVRTHLQLKNALDTIHQYNQQLERIVDERTEALIRAERHAAFSMLIQGIVHNLRNPLNAISGSIQLIEMERNRVNKLQIPDPENDEWKKAQKSFASIWHYTEMAETGTGKLIQMINSLMAKSRADKSDNIELVDLNQLLQREIDFLLADQHFRNHTKRVLEFCEGELMVEVVSSEISQVLQNLIRNAIDAMFEQPDATITIRTGNNAEEVWFMVQDNGPGIPEEVQAKIFDPFFTTKPKADSDSKGPKGTGLGLHMCSEMIRAYNGRIDLESKPGMGAAFRVVLPKNRPEKHEVEADNSQIALI
ncbi:MAG: response regulator [Calditrichia bacterium]|nr:response regulator [Calditrichota bacterium]MCB9067377.1 response regulator [Calditrichia bacterium]